jgi:hypothetical protein
MPSIDHRALYSVRIVVLALAGRLGICEVFLQSHLVNKPKHLVPTLNGIVPLESELRDPPQPKMYRQFSAKESCCGSQHAKYFLPVFFTLHTTDVYLGVLHIRRSADCRNRNEIAKSWVFDLALKQFTHFLADKTVHPLDMISHGLLLSQPPLS